MATTVTLRKKVISGNRESLYLDFYPAIINAKGKTTRREFLNLYLHIPIKQVKRKGKLIPVYDSNPLINNEFADHNRETEILANQKKANRANELGKPEIYSGFEREQLRIKEQGEQDFLKYFLLLSGKRKGRTYSCWIATYKYLDLFSNGCLKFADINEKFCNDFREYLLITPSNKNKISKETLTQNSAAAYYEKFKASLIAAFSEGYLQSDVNKKATPIKKTETQKNFLTLKELNSLAKVDCLAPDLKNAALFSALTGLRFCDILKLTWSEIEYIEGDGYYIRFQQQKTKEFETMPISDQVIALIGERKSPAEKVFQGLEYSAHNNRLLAKWIGLAGITKDITFHCFRHSYATLQLSAGTDIFTVSKMLGHRDLKTTQVYAKVVSQAKRETTTRIKIKFD